MGQQEGYKKNIFYVWTWTFELAKGIFVLIAFLILIHFFIATVFVVDGASMEPNFHNKEYILIEKLSYLIAKPQRGDVVVIKFPGDPEHKKYIKRIIGLPGETLEIKDNNVYINGQKINEFYIPQYVKTLPNMKTTIGPNDYFIMGDNRENSNDSRFWGTCPKNDLIGRAIMILLPTKYTSSIPRIEYQYNY